MSRMIVTRHSPLESVSNLRKYRVVVFGGEVFETDGSESSPGL